MAGDGWRGTEAFGNCSHRRGCRQHISHTPCPAGNKPQAEKFCESVFAERKNADADLAVMAAAKEGVYGLAEGAGFVAPLVTVMVSCVTGFLFWG
jgi:hypothetical protein